MFDIQVEFFFRADEWHKQWFRNILWLLDHAMGEENGLKVFWTLSLEISGCVWRLDVSGV